MNIAALATRIPTRKVTNADIVGMIREHSKGIFQGDLEETLAHVQTRLDQTGVQTRHWLAPGELPMEMLSDALEQVLEQAQITRADIGQLFFTGVARGFTEPANSCVVTDSLGLGCRNFDIMDGYMGWVTCLQILNAKIQNGSIRYGVIVTMEFSMIEGAAIYPQNFALRSADELAYNFASYTVGESLSLTLVGPDMPENFKFKFVARPDASDLTTILLPSWKHFREPSEKLPEPGETFRFRSFDEPSHAIEAQEIIQAYNQLNPDIDAVRWVFPHTGDPVRWHNYANKLGCEDKLYVVAHDTGNIMSASIPVAMDFAIQQGKLQRGDRCLGLQSSPGMKFGALEFVF